MKKRNGSNSDRDVFRNFNRQVHFKSLQFHTSVRTHRISFTFASDRDFTKCITFIHLGSVVAVYECMRASVRASIMRLIRQKDKSCCGDSD